MTAKRGRPRLELAGRRFGSWTVLSFARMQRLGAMWNARCDCGVEAEVRGSSLTAGTSRSCRSCAAIRIGREKVSNPPFAHPALRALRWD